MKDIIPPHDRLIADDELGYVLKRYDPLPEFSRCSMDELEADIFAHIDEVELRQFSLGHLISTRFLAEGWPRRLTAGMALLIVALGFVIGQIAYRETDTVSLLAAPSLLALADETLWQPVPVKDTSWGDSDDDSAE